MYKKALCTQARPEFTFSGTASSAATSQETVHERYGPGSPPPMHNGAHVFILLFLGNLVDAHVVGAQAGGDGGAGTRRARPQLLPGVGAGAAQAGDVGEFEGERGGATRGDDADDDAVTQRARPVRVQLPVDGGGGPGRTEVAGGFAKRVLVDGDDVLAGGRQSAGGPTGSSAWGFFSPCS